MPYSNYLNKRTIYPWDKTNDTLWEMQNILPRPEDLYQWERPDGFWLDGNNKLAPQLGQKQAMNQPSNPYERPQLPWWGT